MTAGGGTCCRVNRDFVIDLVSLTSFAVAKHVSLNARSLLHCVVQLPLQERLDDGSTCRGFGEAALVDASALHRQSLVHHGTSSRYELQVGDCAATWRLVGTGRKRSQSCGRGLLQKWANALGLSEKCFHCEEGEGEGQDG